MYVKYNRLKFHFFKISYNNPLFYENETTMKIRYTAILMNTVVHTLYMPFNFRSKRQTAVHYVIYLISLQLFPLVHTIIL